MKVFGLQSIYTQTTDNKTSNCLYQFINLFMKTTKHYFNLKFAIIVAFSIILANGLQASTLFENFDTPSGPSTNNTAKDITYPSGVWNVCAITKPTTANENDRINGLYSMRMRGLNGSNFMFMKFDKAGAGVLSFNYGSYSNHYGGEFTVQQSTDGGTTWVNTGTPVTVPKWSGTFLTYSYPVNYNGNIRFKIVMTLRTPNNANEQVNIDDFQITDYGTEQTAIPVTSKTTGVYETAQTVSISSATADATIYYTTDGTVATTSSTVYSNLSPLNISTTTKIRAIAVASGKVNSREEVLLISIPEQVATLAEFYTKMATTGTNLTYFKYTGEAIVTASYTATYKTLFLQDNTAGIIISDINRNTNLTNTIGDKITRIIVQVNRVNDSPQLYPYTDFTLVSTGNVITVPVITLADVPNRTNQLVQINDLTFDEANGTKTFGPNTPYIIHDASLATTTTAFRTPSGMPNPDYNGTIIPAKRNIICLIAKNNPAATTHYIFARNAEDLDVRISEVKDVQIYNLSTSGTTVIFETVIPQIVKVFNSNGQAVKSIVSVVGKNSLELAKGVYIIRIGDKTTKVLL